MTSVQPDPTAPLTGSPTAIPTTETTPTEFRYGNDLSIPEYARGKTANEVLGITQQVVGAFQDVARQQAFQPQYVAPTTPQGQDFKDDDIVDGKTLRAYAQTVAQQASNPNMERQLAQLMYDQVSREPKYAEVFQKYGHEVLGQLRGLPHSQWTLDTIHLAANIVRGEHVDELAESKANQKLQGMQGLPIRGNGLGSVQSVDSDGLPANWSEILSKMGASLTNVDGFCVANGWTNGQGQPDRKRWFDYYKDKPVMGGR